MNRADPLRLGILGARSWIANQAVIPALVASTACELVAVAAASGPVPASVAHLDAGSYQAVLDRPDVDAVYLPLPNGLHRHWVEASAAAGKHVLCEKPLGVDAAGTVAMVAACDRAGVLLAEAWMTPFCARWSQVIASADSGRLGEVRDIRAEFTFVIGPGRETNYRWDPGQGGGALLDVGIYALGAAVSLWGAEPVAVHATSRPCRWRIRFPGEAYNLQSYSGSILEVRCHTRAPQHSIYPLYGGSGESLPIGNVESPDRGD